MGKLRKITGSLEIGFKVTLSTWSPSYVGSQPTVGQFVYSYSKFRFLRKRGKIRVAQLSLLWYKRKSPLSDTFNSPANHGGQWSVLCRKEEAWSVWTHTAEVLHVEVKYNEVMLLMQTCFLCGLVSFTVAGRDILPKATQGRKQKRKSSLILHNDTQHSATCIHISLRTFF